jgi:transcriptional regulator with XRE-family HTH domain
MRVIERRLEVELISPQVLQQYIDHRGLSLKKLADAVTLRGVKTSKATIGHLTTGHVKNTRPDRARAICEVLDVPVRALFMDRVSIVQRDVPPRRTATSGGRRRAA